MVSEDECYDVSIVLLVYDVTNKAMTSDIFSGNLVPVHSDPLDGQGSSLHAITLGPHSFDHVHVLDIRYWVRMLNNGNLCPSFSFQPSQTSLHIRLQANHSHRVD